MKKHKRRLEPVRIYDNGDVRCAVTNKLLHKWTPEGLEFRCKCASRLHIIPWPYFYDLLDFLALHRDELWNLLCDGQSLKPVQLGDQQKGTRLVGVIWPSDGILTFVTFVR